MYQREKQSTKRGYQVYFVLWGNSAHPTKNAGPIFDTGAAAEAYAIAELPTKAHFVTSAEIYAVPGLAFVMTVNRVDPPAAAPDFGEDFRPIAAKLDMFAAAGRVDDLPLFSGTPTKGDFQTFVPEQASRQERLF